MRKLLGERLHLDWKIGVISVVSTLLLMVDFYFYPILPWSKIIPGWDATGISMKVLDRTLLYLVIPLFVVLVVFHEPPKNYGFSFGDWKAGIAITLIAIILIAPVLYFVGRGNPAIQTYYKPMTMGLPWSTFLDLFGWEFMFRGWLLFGYSRKFQADAIWLQAVPFALAHLGKPDLETLSTIFGGFAFGWVAWRTKSFIYPFLIHWFVSTFIIMVAAGQLG